jgi:protein disulfide-isomerase A6
MYKPLAVVLVSLLGALPVLGDGLYTKKSPVLQVDSKTYDSLIAYSNYTSVSDFLLECYIGSKFPEKLTPNNS